MKIYEESPQILEGAKNMKGKMFFVNSVMVILMLATVGFAFDTVANRSERQADFKVATNSSANFFAIGSNESQISFSGGTACGGRDCVLTQLKVTGTNQYNNVVRWQQSLSQVYSVRIYNWWWKPNKGISFEFYIQGYGWRSCNITMSRPLFGYPTWLYVKYNGNYACSYY